MIDPDEPCVSLILIGGVHLDPHGKARLTKALESLTPQLVSVEFSPLSLLFRRRFSSNLDGILRANVRNMARAERISSARLLACEPVRRIRRHLELPFEYAASLEFGKKHGVPVVCVDDSDAARSRLGLFLELVSEENIRRLRCVKDVSLDRAVAGIYRRAARLFELGRRLPAELLCLTGESEQEWLRRIRTMRRRILRLRSGLRSRGGGRLVHVGGWLHVGGRGAWPNLLAALSSCRPEGRLLWTPEGETP